MKLVICGSKKAINCMNELETGLISRGHEIISSKFVTDNLENDFVDYFDKINEADSLLVANVNEGLKRYHVDSISFLGMRFAFVSDKSIYLLNSLYWGNKYEEIINKMGSIFLEGNLDLIG
jgi:hypothetical protein